MVGRGRPIFNRSTPRDNVPDQRRGRQELHSGLAHPAQQSLAFLVHEIHLPEVHHGLPPRGGGRSRLPALAQFPHPKTRQFAFQPKAEFTGSVMDGDFEHTRKGHGARSLPPLRVNRLNKIAPPQICLPWPLPKYRQFR
jgi:hypothetical protein